MNNIACFHLPGLFELYDLYRVFLPLYKTHREYFYEWSKIASVYGAPSECIWGGGRLGGGQRSPKDVLDLLGEYGISARLTFSNSLIREEHLNDQKCNKLCALFEKKNGFLGVQNGVIVHSDLLLDYLKERYPGLYFVSSTTKVLTDWKEAKKEIERNDFAYVVPDFRLNKAWNLWEQLTPEQKEKVEFLCNECCGFGCMQRKQCYENVSRKNLGENVPDHECKSTDAKEGYRFSKAMQNPGFISVDDIQNLYIPRGFMNFKIEGRSLGSAIVLEFLLYYMTKPEYQLHVREEIYLDNMLDLF